MVDQEYDFITDEDKATARELHISCLLNAAQCSLKLRDWGEAAALCKKTLDLPGLPDGPKTKALFRRGTANIQLAEFAQARADLLEACRLDPKSKEVRETYASIKAAEAAAKKADAGLFAKMVKGAGGVERKPSTVPGFDRIHQPWAPCDPHAHQPRALCDPWLAGRAVRRRRHLGRWRALQAHPD